jgi:hypothetical protein
MSHPIMFEDDNPHLAEVRGLCLALPEAVEKISHGRPAFFTRKMFAVFGGSVKGDHSSDRCADSLLFVPEPEERPALEQDSRFFLPAYLGAWGWLGLDFRASEVDWQEVAELVECSFRQTAPRELVTQLDAQQDSSGGADLG